MRRHHCWTFPIVFGNAILAAAMGPAAAAGPTREECHVAVEKAGALATELAREDLSRRFAESYLHQAMVEAGNGEFDECLEYAERATEEVTEHRHVLQPGERLKVLRADE